MILQTGKGQDVTNPQNMHHRIPITNLNGHLTCSLCKGYFVDATTIIECLHSFCRSCIVKYLQTNRYCPVCDVQVHKTKPLLNIRPDKTLQDIVYKLVPRLFQNEMQRRRQYYSDHPDVKPSGLEQCGEASYQHLLTPDESICISFNYHGNSRTRRYLRCPAAVSVSHLQKLIRAKYDLKDNHRVDILYNQDCLNSYLTLMDIAYIYLWRRKGPMEITYRIYENTAKRVKVQEALPDGEGGAEENAGVVLNNNNNSIKHNDWKEVQLRISENGEMSVTGIQDCLDMLDEHIEAIDETSRVSSEGQPNNKGGAGEVATCESDGGTSSSVVGVVVTEETSKKEKKRKGKVQQSESGAFAVAVHNKQVEVVTNCSTKEAAIGGGGNNNNNGSKRKLVEVVGEAGEPPTKKSKPPPPNHSVGLQNLSNNHPLKKHSLNKVDGGNKSNKVNSDIKKEVTINTAVISATTTTTSTITTLAAAICTTSINTVTMTGVVAASTTVTSSSEMSKKERKVSKAAEKQQSVKVLLLAAPSSVISTSSILTTTVTSSSAFTRPSNVNTSKHATTNNTRPVTPVASTTLTTTTMTTPSPGQKWGKTSTPGPPSYIPKPAYSPIINVPKVQPSTSSSSSSVKQVPSEINTTQSSMISKTNSSAVTPKSKPNSPMGYTTLRDPPKTWNPQIARPKPSATAESSKNARPAKFFKMRNNIPRYLGNPASGVKPLYQVQHNVEKEKPRPEIKRHSIVKIDPKTLKPVSERAPESSNLTNITTSQPDLKISTSSVPIFNPLKLQSSPKSADRKSPQSPKKSPTTSKRDKLNLSYTPPNPFIPNISPTLNPQFLYPRGPPGFPTYDPRYMAAYHSLFFGSRLPAPYNPSTTLPSPHPTVGGLNLEMTSPRANSPKNSAAKPKKTKEEKSLQNAVEKLTKIKSEETKAAKKEERTPSGKEDEEETRKKKSTATTTTTLPVTMTTTATVVDSKEASCKQVEIKQKSESNVDINNQNNNTIAAVDNGDKSDNNVEKMNKK